MLMYKHGRAVRRINYLAGITITASVLALSGGIYFFFISKSKTSNATSNQTPLVTKHEATAGVSLTVSEPLFSMQLPGQWKESARDNDPSFHSIQWNYTGGKSSDKWVRIYMDTIPTTMAFNYLLPVVPSEGGGLSPGQISDNCVNFTQGANPANRDASTPIASESLTARWQQVTFPCDNTHTSHQVVGTGSTEGGNVVTVTGPTRGSHKYFFMFKDDNYHPDYSLFSSVLSSFKAK